MNSQSFKARFTKTSSPQVLPKQNTSITVDRYDELMMSPILNRLEGLEP